MQWTCRSHTQIEFLEVEDVSLSWQGLQGLHPRIGSACHNPFQNALLTLSRSWFHFAGKYTLIWANTTQAYKTSQTSVVSVVYKRNLRSVLWSPRRREKSEICANNTFNKHQHHQGTKTTNIWRIVCPLYRGYEIVWMKEVIMLTFSQRIKEWNVCDDPWNWLPSDFIHEMFSNFRVLQFYNLSTDWRFSCGDTLYPWSHNKRMFLLMRSLCAKKTFSIILQ